MQSARLEAQICVEREEQEYRVRVAGMLRVFGDGRFEADLDAACDDDGGLAIGQPIDLTMEEMLRAEEALYEAWQHPELDHGSGCRNPFCVMQVGHPGICSALFLRSPARA